MARVGMTFLSEREEDLIHEQSIKILEEIGVKVHSRSVLKLLEEKGAAVEHDTMIAKLPEELVNERPCGQSRRPSHRGVSVLHEEGCC